MRKLFISLFTGAGGLDHGFIDAGWEPAFMVDNWQPALDTLAANHRGVPVYGWDLSDRHDPFLALALDGLRLRGVRDRVLCVVGGPPCQPLSRLNNNQLFDGSRETERNLNDPRRSLFMSFLRVVRKVDAPFVVMENVADLMTRKLGGSGTDKNRQILDVVLEEFDKAGDVRGRGRQSVNNSKRRLPKTSMAGSAPAPNSLTTSAALRPSAPSSPLAQARKR